jgi:hypothetical protein
MSVSSWTSDIFADGEKTEQVTWYDRVFGQLNTAIQAQQSYPTWTDIPLSGGWAADTTGWGAPQCRIQRGFVYIRGMIRGGTITAGTVIATLPLGFTPSGNLIFQCANNLTASGARIDVHTDGSMSLGQAAPSASYISLCNIIFRGSLL